MPGAMTQPPEYVTRISAPGIHNEPPQSFQLTQLTQDQIRVAREKTWTSILQIVIQGLTGVYIPGGGTSGAENQLSDWAESVQDVPIVGDILEILTGVPDADTNDLGTWVLNFFNNPLGTLFPSAVPQLPPDRIDSSAGGSGNLWDDLTNTWNNFWNGIFGTSATGVTPDGVGEAASNISNRADNANASTQTLTAFWSTPRILPPWIGALSDDVSFDVDRIDGTSLPPLGQITLIPVKATQDRLYDAIKFGLTSANMTNCYVALYDADETTGDLSKVLDLGDCKSQLDTSINQQTIDIPSPISVQRGELYYIAVLHVGGSTSAMHRSSATTNFTTGQYPRFRGNAESHSGWTVMPTTIVQSDVVSGTRYWGALGTAADPVTPGLVFLSDNFNRSDLGPSWSVRQGGVFISNGTTAKGNNIFSANIATHNTRLSSQSQRVGYHVYGTSPGNNFCRLRGNGFGQCIAFRVRLDASTTPDTKVGEIVQITSNFGSTLTLNVRASSTNQSVLAGDWRMDAISNTYTLYRNNVQVAQWVDSGGLYPIGTNYTEVGFHANTSASDADNMDDWFAQDL